MLSLSIFIFSSYAHSEILGPYLLSPDEIPITLSDSGQIYALSGDVVGDITITANDVTINLNERTVTGRIIISGERVLIYGGKIVAPAPADNVTADAGVVQINPSATNAQIIDCYISAADTTVAAVRGARGITVDADDVIIRNSFVQAGSSTAVGGLASGGVGIQSSSNNLLLDNNTAYGGNGTDSNASGVTTGAGGAGYVITSGTEVVIVASSFFGGNSGDALNGAISIVLASGGDGITIGDSVQVIINNSLAHGGNSGSRVGASTGLGGVFTMGNGGNGITSIASQLIMKDSALYGGNVGSASMTELAVSVNTEMTPGHGGSGLQLNNGAINSEIELSTFYGGLSGAVTVTITVTTVGNVIVFAGGSGGHAVAVAQQVDDDIVPQAIIKNCNLIGGAGVDMQISLNGGIIGSTVSGNDAGSGLFIDDAVFGVSLIETEISTLRGGAIIYPAAVSGNPNLAGIGGIGVNIFGAGATNIKIADNNIVQTGDGGNVTGGGAGGIGGDGGTGIVIVDTNASAELSNNTIAYTGVGGAAATGGNGGQAINSASTTAQTIIYGNYAYAIATGTIYSFAAGNIDGALGTAFALAAGTNFLFNIHKP